MRLTQPEIKPIKRSDYMPKYEKADSIVVPEDRTTTKFGYTARGYSGNNFEIVYDVMSANAATPSYYHPKKDRVIRVLAGTGMFHSEGKSTKINIGDDITVLAGTRYHISSETALYLMIVQPSKFSAHLETDDSTEVEVTADQEEAPSSVTRPVFYPRTPSKAAIQQLELQQLLRPGEAAITPPTTPAAAPAMAPSKVPMGPSYGRDLPGAEG